MMFNLFQITIKNQLKIIMKQYKMQLKELEMYKNRITT